MSDEQSNKAPETTETETTEAPAQGPDWVKESRKWEGRAKAANAELEALREKASKLDEIEESKKSEMEKLSERLAKAEARAAEFEKTAAEKDRALLAERVAASKGVKAKYLHGDTEEELIASADEFLADIKGITPERSPGVVPSAGTGGPRPSAASVDTGRERALAALNAQSK